MPTPTFLSIFLLFQNTSFGFALNVPSLPAINEFCRIGGLQTGLDRSQSLPFHPNSATNRLRRSGARGDGAQVFSKSNECEDDDDNDDTAYGNRSISWTRRYRRLIPYEHARKSVMKLGLRSKEEWDEYVADGKKSHGPYLPSRPDEMYSDDWESWEEFLGLMRPYEDARNLVQHVLRLKTNEEYSNFVKDDPKRAEGLRIPAKPDVVYEGKGWSGFDAFFGTSS